MFVGRVFETAALVRFLATQPEIIILNPAIRQFSGCMGIPKGPKDFVKLETFHCTIYAILEQIFNSYVS